MILATIRAKKPNKYRNVKTVVDGISFDSKREARRWQELVLLERAGKIRDLERQTKFQVAPAVILDGRKKPAVVYKADFSYRDPDTRRLTIEDCKGVSTAVYRLKRHLLALIGIHIREIK